MDSSILDLDDAISLYDKHMDFLTNAFKENTNARKVVMGGDGAYIRLKEANLLGEETDPWRYRTNAADAIDYFQSSLITDIHTRYIHKDIKDPSVSLRDIIKKYQPYNSRFRPNRLNLLHTHIRETYYECLKQNYFYKDFRDAINKKNNVDFVNNIKENINADKLIDARKILYDRIDAHFEGNDYLKIALKKDMMVILESGASVKIFFVEKGKEGKRVFSIGEDGIRCERNTLLSLIEKLGGNIIGTSEVVWPTTAFDSNKNFKDFALMNLINSLDNGRGLGLTTARDALELVFKGLRNDSPCKSSPTRFYLSLKGISDQEIIDTVEIIGMIEKLDDYCSFIKDRKSTYIPPSIRPTDLRAIDIKLVETNPGSKTFKIEINLVTNPKITSLKIFNILENLRYLVPEALSFNNRYPELFGQFERAMLSFHKPYKQAHKYENVNDQGPYKIDKDNNWAYFIRRYVDSWARGGFFGQKNT